MDQPFDSLHRLPDHVIIILEQNWRLQLLEASTIHTPRWKGLELSTSTLKAAIAVSPKINSNEGFL